MTEGRQKILIIDDDVVFSEMLSTYLERHGFETTPAFDCRTGRAAAIDENIDMVLLDLALPDGSGADVCKFIRERRMVPIIMLTASGDETDRIVGLETGADDYLAKPFNPRELVARIRAVLRRGHATNPERVLSLNGVSLEASRREVVCDGRHADLTARQFDILQLLMQRAGRVQTRANIMEDVTGGQYDAFDRSIDVHISRIRAQIETDPKRPQRLKSVRGVGYVFVPAAPQ